MANKGSGPRFYSLFHKRKPPEKPKKCIVCGRKEREEYVYCRGCKRLRIAQAEQTEVPDYDGSPRLDIKEYLKE